MYDTRTHVPLGGRSFAVEHQNFGMSHLAQLGIVHRLARFKGVKTYLFTAAFID